VSKNTERNHLHGKGTIEVLIRQQLNAASTRLRHYQEPDPGNGSPQDAELIFSQTSSSQCANLQQDAKMLPPEEMESSMGSPEHNPTGYGVSGNFTLSAPEVQHAAESRQPFPSTADNIFWSSMEDTTDADAADNGESDGEDDRWMDWGAEGLGHEAPLADGLTADDILGEDFEREAARRGK
jgi:hypothetical protein